jgi:hypothetical protein
VTIQEDRRRPTPRDVPARPKLSGCALRHTEAECDCVRPYEAEAEQVGCRDCWGSGDYCGGCGGWGVTTRHGGWIHRRVAGSGATGPSTARNTDDWDIAPGDPWADATSVIDIPF